MLTVAHMFQDRFLILGMVNPNPWARFDHSFDLT